MLAAHSSAPRTGPASAAVGDRTPIGTSAPRRSGTARYSRRRARQARQVRRCGRSAARSAGRRLAVGQSGEPRREALALCAGLDARQPLEEGPPALGQAAVDLRVGPARLRADLAVAVALGPEQQAAHLLRLQAPERLRAHAQPLEALGALMGLGLRRRRLGQVGRRARRRHTAALAADGQGLALGDRAQPAAQLVVGAARLVGQEDLRGPLVGVLGVLGLAGVATCCGQHVLAEALEQRELAGVDRPSCAPPLATHPLSSRPSRRSSPNAGARRQREPDRDRPLLPQSRGRRGSPPFCPQLRRNGRDLSRFAGINAHPGKIVRSTALHSPLPAVAVGEVAP